MLSRCYGSYYGSGALLWSVLQPLDTTTVSQVSGGFTKEHIKQENYRFQTQEEGAEPALKSESEKSPGSQDVSASVFSPRWSVVLLVDSGNLNSLFPGAVIPRLAQDSHV